MLVKDNTIKISLINIGKTKWTQKYQIILPNCLSKCSTQLYKKHPIKQPNIFLLKLCKAELSSTDFVSQAIKKIIFLHLVPNCRTMRKASNNFVFFVQYLLHMPRRISEPKQSQWNLKERLLLLYTVTLLNTHEKQKYAKGGRILDWAWKWGKNEKKNP